MKEAKEEVEVSRDSGQALLVYAVAATVFTVRKPAAGTTVLSQDKHHSSTITT